MSADIRTATIDVLSPLVGKAMATVYLSQAALNRGKSTDALEAADLDWLCDEIRRAMSPFATKAVVENAIASITEQVRG